MKEDNKKIKTKRWAIKCCITNKELKFLSNDYYEANDYISDAGWTYDRFLGGFVCPETKEK